MNKIIRLAAVVLLSLWVLNGPASLVFAQSPMHVCKMKVDDDEDFLVDCKDPDCDADPVCAPPCDSLSDTDGDGLSDCDDPCPIDDPTNTCDSGLSGSAFFSKDIGGLLLSSNNIVGLSIK